MNETTSLVVSVLAVAALQLLSRQFARRRARAKLTRRYATLFDATAERAELDDYVRTVREGLPHLNGAPLELPDGALVDERWLAAAIASAARRFEVPLAALRWRVSEAPAGRAVAGCAWRPARTSLRLDGDLATVTRHEGVDEVWSIELAAQYRADPEAAFVVVGHEMAHVALLSRGIRLNPARSNERLTDVAAALGGFGGVMRRVAERQQWSENGKEVRLKVGVVGYLHRDAVGYLNAHHLVAAS